MCHWEWMYDWCRNKVTTKSSSTRRKFNLWTKRASYSHNKFETGICCYLIGQKIKSLIATQNRLIWPCTINTYLYFIKYFWKQLGPVNKQLFHFLIVIGQ